MKVIKQYEIKALLESSPFREGATGKAPLVPDAGRPAYTQDRSNIQDYLVNHTEDILPDKSKIREAIVPDGGQEQLYFWYDPGTNAILQEQIEPVVWAGVFDQREEAVEFGKSFDEYYESVEVSSFELYEATCQTVGTGEDLLR